MTWMVNTGEVTHDPLVSGTFKWTVPNFFKAIGNANFIFVESPSFSFQNDEWRFMLQSDERKFQYSDVRLRVNRHSTFIGLFLRRKHVNSTEEFVADISLLATQPSPCLEYSFDRRWTVAPDQDIVGTCKFLPMSVFSERREEVSPLGFLKITCTIRKLDSDANDANSEDNETAETESTSSDQDETEQVAVDNKKNVREPKGVDRLLKNLEKMLLDGDNSDAVLKVGNQEFPVHKGLLSTRSPVFASMFQHPMKEGISGIADIPDCKVEAFRVFLRYIYIGRADTISAENVFSVYYAADKYRVDDLKEDCVEFMKKTLSVDTFCDVIALSLKHDESGLQKAATSFFRDNIRKIIKTVQWQRYIQENPIQGNELYIKALNA